MRWKLTIWFIGFSVLLSSAQNPGAALSEQLVTELARMQIDLPPDHPDARYNGLWWSQVRTVRNSVFFGKKGLVAPDVNCFVSVLVHNSLAETYARDTSLVAIPAMLDKTHAGLEIFRDDEAYNFFPLSPSGPRPSHYTYRCFVVRKAFNINPDADDTALVWYAGFLHDPERSDSLGWSLLKLLRPYRDTPGSGINFWNFFTGTRRHTGAFETWLPADTCRDFFHLFPKKRQRYIPYGVNDVDCVLNANVMGVLSALGAGDAPEVQEAGSWLVSLIREQRCRNCAIYYPIQNSLAYAVALAIHRGARVLEPAAPDLVQQLLSTRLQDGSWQDPLRGNSFQATLYAVNSLMMLSSLQDESTAGAVHSGIRYLLRIWEENSGMTGTPAGVAFSAGSVFSRKHVWVSDAWTQALLLETLTLYQNYEEE